MRKDVSYEKIFEGPNLDIYYASNHMLYADWHGNPSARSVKDGCNSKSEFLKNLKCQLLLNDNRRLTGGWMESVDWIRDIHLPELASNGLRKLAHIYSPDNAPNNSMNTLLEYPHQIDVQVFSDFESASQWLTGNNVVAPSYSSLLNIRSGGRTVRLNSEDILFISRFNRKSVIQLKEEEIISAMSLSQFEEMLPLSTFMRVHKSYIINVKKVRSLKYHAGGYYRAYFKDFGNAFVTISKLQSKDLKTLLEKQ